MMSLKWLYWTGILLGVGSAVSLLAGGFFRLPWLLDLAAVLGLLAALLGLVGAGARERWGIHIWRDVLDHDGRRRVLQAFWVYSVPVLLGTLGVWVASGRRAPHEWTLEALVGLILVLIAIYLATRPGKV